MVESGKTNAYSFSHAFGMTAPSGRELRLSTKIGETNSFSHAFGMTAPSSGRELRLSTGSLSSRDVFQELRVLGGVWGRAPGKVFL